MKTGKWFLDEKMESICGKDGKMLSFTDDLTQNYIETVNMLDKLICINSIRDGFRYTPSDCIGFYDFKIDRMMESREFRKLNITEFLTNHQRLSLIEII